MTERCTSDPTLDRLIHWAQGRAAVRAMLLTGSRANPQSTVDALSDYDVVLVVEDVRPFYDDRSWLDDFGAVLVAYWDPIHPAPGHGIEQVSNVIQYQDGIEIDFTLWPVPLCQLIAVAPTLPPDLDCGYAVLLDKDGLTGGLPAPTHTAHLPQPPAEATFQTLVQDFLSDAPYVAKCLLRDELLPAKWCLDYDMKHNFLRQALEWLVGCQRGWDTPVGVLGRGLKRQLPPDLWLLLERTYVGADIEENWEALFRTLALFRRAAMEVAAQLGYAYPLDLDQRVTAHVQRLCARAHEA
jgi:aminoglycoside 6-adenylyltransferase